jgi:hypothetical protein
MLTKGVNAIYESNRCLTDMKHVNSISGRNVELLNIKTDGIYSYQYALEG